MGTRPNRRRAVLDQILGLAVARTARAPGSKSLYVGAERDVAPGTYSSALRPSLARWRPRGGPLPLAGLTALVAPW